MAKLYVKIKVAWWLRYYLKALIFMCKLFGRMPDGKKLEKIIELAVTETAITTKEPTKDFDA